MPNFFISYRRRDQSGMIMANMICRELRARYGEKSIFLDVDSRTPGLSFPVKVERALKATDVVLVVIGPDWLRLLNERRGDPRDWVRYEVAESLKRSELPVVPVCLPEVEVPRPDELPKELEDLGWRDGITLDPGPEFDGQLSRLLRDLERLLESAKGAAPAATAQAAAQTPAPGTALPVYQPPPATAPVRPTSVIPASGGPQFVHLEPPRNAPEQPTPLKSVPAASAPVQPVKPVPVSSASVAPAPVKQATPTPAPGKASARSPAPPVSKVDPPRAPAPTVTPRSTASPPKPVRRIADRHNFLALFAALVCTWPVALVLAIGYSTALLKMPFVQLNLILTIVYGVAVGVVAGWTFIRFRVWNGDLAFFGSLLVGFCAVYLSLIVWTQGYFHHTSPADFLEFLFHRSEMLSVRKPLLATGSWTIWGYRPTGWVLRSIWVLEAVLIVGLSGISGWITTEVQTEGKCGFCAKKLTVHGAAAKLQSQGRDRTELIRRIHAKDFPFLRSLGAPKPGTGEWLQIDVYRCKSCFRTNVLKAYVGTRAQNVQKQTVIQFASLVTNLTLTVAEVDEIVAIGRQAAALAESGKLHFASL